MIREKNLVAMLMAVFVATMLCSCGQDSKQGSSEDVSSSQKGPRIKPTGEKIELCLHFTEGDSFKHRITTQQVIDQEPQGQKQVVKQTIGMGFTYDVIKVSGEGTAEVKVTYASVLMKQESGGISIEYDSANPPDVIPPMAQGIAALVGLDFTMHIAPNGRISKIDGADELLTKIVDKIGVQDTMKEDVKSQMAEQFGDQALTEMMEQMLAIYPDKPVDIGDSWSKESSVAKGFPVTIANTWTLIDRKDGAAVVEVDSTVTPDADSSPSRMGPLSLKYQLSGKQNGTIEIDETTGWPIKTQIVQDLSGNVTVEGAPGATEPMTWPISVKGDILAEMEK